MHRPGPAGHGGRGRGDRRIPAKKPRLAVLTTGAGAAVLAVSLSACGGAGLTLARQACVHVKSSLTLYAQSQSTTDHRKAAADRVRAIEQLEVALPLAAQATSADPQWNPLMITLQEIGRSSEADLVPALRSQCAHADSPNEQAPYVPSTVAGTPTSPGPSSSGR